MCVYMFLLLDLKQEEIIENKLYFKLNQRRTTKFNVELKKIRRKMFPFV